MTARSSEWPSDDRISPQTYEAHHLLLRGATDEAVAMALVSIARSLDYLIAESRPGVRWLDAVAGPTGKKGATP